MQYIPILRVQTDLVLNKKRGRNVADLISEKIKYYGSNVISDIEFFEKEIQEWKVSKKRALMITGDNYYRGEQDILKKTRQAIGENGNTESLTNLPNTKIVDNQYSKMVDQKKNYLYSQPFTLKTENQEYSIELKKIFNKKFNKLLKNLAEDSVNCGIGWLIPYYDEKGQFRFKRFRPWQIIAGWKDEEHTILDYAIRVYPVTVVEGKQTKEIEKVEIYKQDGIYKYTLVNNKLVPDVEPFQVYFTINNEKYSWHNLPLIAFKYNDNEIPLISKVKSLQDAINTILSNFNDNMLEDSRNTILVLVNYDGENLGEFRSNLNKYGVVKIKNTQGGGGDLRSLQIEVNAENYKAIYQILKDALIENASGYNAKDDRLMGNPNQMNILSMYSDIELDCNELETEYQSSFEDLLWFINMHLHNVHKKDFTNEVVDIEFNRNIMISVSEKIQNINSSITLMSKKSLLAQHPWVDDVDTELKLLEEEKKQQQEEYNPFVTDELKNVDKKDEEKKE